MRRGMTWTWGLALGGILALAFQAKADDDEAKPAPKSNWFIRLFVRDPATKKKNTDAKNETSGKPASLSPALARQKAQWELMRRQEVCDKLRQIALETGDKDLGRKADALDQRAWDLYVLRTGGSKSNPSPDEQFLDSHLGMDAVQRPGSLATSGSSPLNGEGRTAGRKD